MPVIVGSPAEVPGLIERMQMHRLSNPDPSLRFALLSDHIDAPAEHMSGDSEVEEKLRKWHWATQCALRANR